MDLGEIAHESFFTKNSFFHFHKQIHMSTSAKNELTVSQRHLKVLHFSLSNSLSSLQ